MAVPGGMRTGPGAGIFLFVAVMIGKISGAIIVGPDFFSLI